MFVAVGDVGEEGAAGSVIALRTGVDGWGVDVFSFKLDAIKMQPTRLSSTYVKLLHRHTHAADGATNVP